jgi:MarR family transcriptional regulator, organic hydroperoxide resistance regulator
LTFVCVLTIKREKPSKESIPMRKRNTPSPESTLPEGEVGGVLSFLQRLWALDHRLQSYSKSMLDKLGVTGPQRLVVRLIGQCPGISAGQLAGILQIHPSTLTGVSQRLERRGLIRRAGVPYDGRRVVYHLTPRGRRINEDHSGSVEAILEEALSKIPADRVEAAKEVLSLLVTSLEEKD